MPPFYANKHVAVVGASRGLGLEWCKQLLARGNTVHAGIRTQTKELDALAASSAGKLTTAPIDVTQPAYIAAWADGVKAATPRLDLVIGNAGVAKWTGLRDVTAEEMMALFQTNTVGPLLVTQALLARGLLQKGSTVANVTSKMGSIDDSSGGTYAYRASKAALNCVTVQMDHDLQDQSIRCTVLHPGWVATRMTSDRGLIDCETSVAGMLSVLEDKASGKLDPAGWFDYKKEEIKW